MSEWLCGAELPTGIKSQHFREFSFAQFLYMQVSLQRTELRKVLVLVRSSEPLRQYGCQLLDDDIAQIIASICVLKSSHNSQIWLNTAVPITEI